MTLSLGDIAGLLAKMGESGVVLIGGQAINLWAAEFDHLGGIPSHDVDFQGSPEEATRAAEALAAELLLPLRPDTVNTAVLNIRLENGAKVSINVVRAPAGLTAAEVYKTAVSIEIAGGRIRVMHPVLMLESRIINIFSLHRESPHSLEQAKTSVDCAAAAIRQISADDPKNGRQLCERVFRFAKRKEAKYAYREHGIDVFKAVQPLPELGVRFLTQRLPQMNMIMGKR